MYHDSSNSHSSLNDSQPQQTFYFQDSLKNLAKAFKNNNSVIIEDNQSASLEQINAENFNKPQAFIKDSIKMNKLFQLDFQNQSQTNNFNFQLKNKDIEKNQFPFQKNKVDSSNKKRKIQIQWKNNFIQNSLKSQKMLIQPQNMLQKKLKTADVQNNTSYSLPVQNVFSEEQFSLSFPKKTTAFPSQTAVIGLDCEMVICQKGLYDKQNELARISIVNQIGQVLFDQYIQPKAKIVNYLTWVSGITKQLIKNAKPFSSYKNQIESIIKDKIIIGHSLFNDFQAMNYHHNEFLIRDITTFNKFKDQKTFQPISLKKLAKIHLNLNIQNGSHSSVEDSQTCILLYNKFQSEIESDFKKKNYLN